MSELLFDKINGLIAEATFARNDTRMLTLRAIKAELLKAKTAKNAKPLDQNTEFQIIQKMVKQREESAKMYDDASRPELANNERAEIAILQEFLPKEPTKEDIEECIKSIASSFLPVKANMGQYMKLIKAAYPTVNGKLAAQLVNENLV